MPAWKTDMNGAMMQELLIAVGEWFFFYIPAAIIAIAPVIKWMHEPVKRMFPFIMGILCAVCVVCPMLSVFIDKHPIYGLIDVSFVTVLLLFYLLLIDLEKVKLLYLIICDMTLMSFGGLVYHITAAVFHPEGTMQDSSGWGLLAQITVNLLIVLFFCAVVRKKLTWVIENFHNTTVWAIAGVIPAIILFCNYMMVPRYYSTIKFRRIFRISVVLIVTLFVLFVTLQIMLYLIIRYLVEKYEMDRSAYMLQMPLFILLIGLIYLVEVLSVMIQVSYFKATHGKRIFKMAPIHHHFEFCGWSETRIVAVFSVITAVMCLIALLAL